MEKEHSGLKNILNLLKDQRGFDFHGYRMPMLERRIQKRLYDTRCQNTVDYLEFLNHHPDELDHLIDVFTINVSRFFRNALSFEYIRKIILPILLLDKVKENEKSLRIWSAGCSYGEEAYSMAIIINELLEKEKRSLMPNIFATDIDQKALKRAKEGLYGFKSVENVKYGILRKYFKAENQDYRIDSEIKKMVQFSFYDLLDKKMAVPSDSIFGGFDMVLCRNVLIYFEPDYQKLIFNKLYKSLKPNGYLVLGEAEIPIEGFKEKFKRESRTCKIFRKIG